VTPAARTVLHVGCGTQRIADAHRGFAGWREIRVDADAAVQPDVVASMTDLGPIPSSSVDAIYSSHSLEHLYAHEVHVALTEFQRALRAGGFLLLTCPDLQEVCQLVAEDRLLETAYVSPAGPIAAVDMIYGHRPAIAGGNLFMAHRCGFTARVLLGTLQAAGYMSAHVVRRPEAFALWALATPLPLAPQRAEELMRQFFPAE